MRKFYLLFLLGITISKVLSANSGICESYAILNINGAGNVYYDMQAVTANPDFNGNNLGSFNIGSNSLILNGAQNKIYKCVSDNIYQSYFYYRIYKTTATPGVFNSSVILYNSNIAPTACSCGGTDQLWESSGANINVLNGLTPGTYYLEIYTNADFTYAGGSGTHYANNGGANYKATFTVSPVYVTSTTGTSPATYATLKTAFDAINAGTHKGTIAVTIYGNTTETSTAALNSSGSGSSSYTTVTIKPSGLITVSGSIDGLPLVDLNGADNVTIDGLNDGTNSLIISNTSVSNLANTSTIRFINDATNNTITNVTIQGSSTTALNSKGGTIFFSTAATGGSGNDNNLISNCNIGAAGSNIPNTAILGQGSNISSAHNSNVVITNCNIYDFFDVVGGSRGIYIDDGNTNWTISNNKIYQTSNRAWTSSSGSGYVQRAISIIQSASVGSNFQITNNTIGFSNSSGTGTYNLQNYTNAFIGIDLKTGSITATTVQGNIIAGISQTTTAQNSSNGVPAFVGIYAESGLFTISNNTIGGSAAGNKISFASSNVNPNDWIGIYSTASSTITSNTIDNIAVTSTGNATTLSGIRAATSVTNVINGNTIGSTNGLSSTATSGKVVGIYIESGTPTVMNNKIAALSTPYFITGIGVYGGSSALVYNNFIALGSGVTSNSIMAGIEHNGGTSPSFYYNTVRLQGAVSSGGNSTAAFMVSASLSATAINNIFYNERSGGTGVHYGIMFGLGVNYTGDYNDIYAAGGQTGTINGSGNFSGIANWRTGSGQDANSIEAAITFTSTTDLHIAPASYTVVKNKGVDISPTVTTDIDGENRKPSCGTDVGADEIYFNNTAGINQWTGASDTKWCNACNWDKETIPSSSDSAVITTSLYGNYPVLNTAAGCGASVIGGLSITGSASLTIGTGGSLTVNGGFNNAATFTQTGGDINFAGTSSKTIASTTDLSFYNVTFSGGGAKNLTANATVHGTLGLTSGIVNVSASKYLALPAGISYTGGGPASYVNGTLRKYFSAAETSFTFPVGNATRYGSISLTNIVAPSTAEYMDVSYATGAFSGNHRNILTPTPAAPTNSTNPVVFASYVEYWNISFINTGSSFKAQVTLNYNDNNFSQLYNKGADWLRVTRYDAAGVMDYGNDNPLADQPLGSGTYSGSINSAQQLGASAFAPGSIFTFGTTANGVNPLPVLIKEFTAVKQNNFNQLNWNISCSSEELRFEVMRSTDGRNYQVIQQLTASQERCKQPFDYNDYTATGEKVYYRVKMTDENGKIAYTQVAVIINRKNGLEITGLFPNPSTDVIYLNVSAAARDRLQLFVTDITGKQVISNTIVLIAGSNLVPLQLKSLAKGVYTINGIYSDGKITTLKFIKQ